MKAYSVPTRKVVKIEKIRQIVNEAEVRLEKRIEVQGERFSAEIQAEGRHITDLRSRIDFHRHLIIALIGAIIAFVSVPLGFIA